MKTLKDQRGISQNFLLIGIVIIVAIAFIYGLFLRSERNIGVGSEYSDPSGPALIENSQALYQKVNDPLAMTELRNNLAFYARSTIKAYQKGQPVDIIFTISKKMSAQGNQFEFEGKFKASKDTFKVGGTVLGYGKLKLSITNTKSGQNIDDQLPTNSKENQFIGSLPVENGAYRIEYNSSVGSYNISGLTSDSSIEQQAINYIAEGTGKTANELKILFLPLLDDSLGHDEQQFN